MEAMIGAAGRDVDRHVADQVHAALRRVGAQSAPLAFEAHLVVYGARPGHPLPVADPEGVPLAERGRLRRGDAGGRLCEQVAPGGERGTRAVGRGLAVRWAEREHLPP